MRSAHRLRFRTRLVIEFVAVAALASGLLAVASYQLARGYREAGFNRQADRIADVSLLAAADTIDAGEFQQLIKEYQLRGGFETVAVAGSTAFASSPQIDRSDIPAAAAATIDAGDRFEADISVDGYPYRVIGGRSAAGDADLFFFFSRRLVVQNMAEMRRALGIGWIVATAVAALVGWAVATRTLRPVRRTADVALAIAGGDLDQRLMDDDPDEFGVLARAFNQMTDALVERIEGLRRQAERERRFTADVAHELRTPLAGMVAAASLLERRRAADAGRPDDVEAQTDPVEHLVEDVRRLHLLVDELLELARLDSGREDANLETISVPRALDAVMRPWGASRPDPVPIDSPDDLVARADRAGFRRVLDNLVANADLHGGGCTGVSAHRLDDAVVIEVCDRGPGIPDDEQETVFDRFAKADTSRSGPGSGLGLAIARQHARLQGGDLTVANRPGGGAVFRFVLPVGDGAAGAPGPGPVADTTARDDPT